MAWNVLTELRKIPVLPVLSVGGEDWSVKILRRALSEHGFGAVSWTDLRTDVSDYFDTSLETLVRAFQTDRELVADGIVGPNTWSALKEDAPTSAIIDPNRDRQKWREQVRAAIVQVAEFVESLNPRESGRNRGPIIETFIRNAGGKLGDPYCVDFCEFCVSWGYGANGLGARPPFEIGRSASGLVATAKRNGALIVNASVAIPGDLFVLRGGKTGYSHAGIVVAGLDANRRLTTVEGNTNAAGSAEGDGVYRKRRDPLTGVAVQVV